MAGLMTPSMRDALQMICATEDESKNAGHLHRLTVKIARAALFNHAPALSVKDLEHLRRNWPKGQPFPAHIGETP